MTYKAFGVSGYLRKLRVTGGSRSAIRAYGSGTGNLLTCLHE